MDHRRALLLADHRLPRDELARARDEPASERPGDPDRRPGLRRSPRPREPGPGHAAPRRPRRGERRHGALLREPGVHAHAGRAHDGPQQRANPRDRHLPRPRDDGPRGDHDRRGPARRGLRDGALRQVASRRQPPHAPPGPGLREGPLSPRRRARPARGPHRQPAALHGRDPVRGRRPRADGGVLHGRVRPTRRALHGGERGGGPALLRLRRHEHPPRPLPRRTRGAARQVCGPGPVGRARRPEAGGSPRALPRHGRERRPERRAPPRRDRAPRPRRGRDRGLPARQRPEHAPLRRRDAR